MAHEQSRTEVPDSEDEPLSSSPSASCMGDVDKLHAAGSVPSQARQDTLQQVACASQAQAKDTANAASSDIEILGVDRNSVSSNDNLNQDDPSAIQTDKAAPRTLQGADASTDKEETQCSVSGTSAEMHDTKSICSVAAEYALSSEEHHDRDLVPNDEGIATMNCVNSALLDKAINRDPVNIETLRTHEKEIADVPIPSSLQHSTSASHHACHAMSTATVLEPGRNPREMEMNVQSNGPPPSSERPEQANATIDCNTPVVDSHDGTDAGHEQSTQLLAQLGKNSLYAQEKLRTVKTSHVEENLLPVTIPLHTPSAATASEENLYESLPPSMPVTPQEITLAELRAQRAAVIADLASLPAIQVLIEENASLDTAVDETDNSTNQAEVVAAANKIVKDHIKLLHQYNELKDVGQGLMGLIADQRGVRIVEVQDEFGIDARD